MFQYGIFKCLNVQMFNFCNRQIFNFTYVQICIKITFIKGITIKKKNPSATVLKRLENNASIQNYFRVKFSNPRTSLKPHLD